MKTKNKVCISLRLSEEENEKLKQNAAVCGLSETEFIRQLCAGRRPTPQPSRNFWSLMEGLYALHDDFKSLIPYAPEASEVCREIETLILRLQEAA